MAPIGAPMRKPGEAGIVTVAAVALDLHPEITAASHSSDCADRREDLLLEGSAGTYERPHELEIGRRGRVGRCSQPDGSRGEHCGGRGHLLGDLAANRFLNFSRSSSNTGCASASSTFPRAITSAAARMRRAMLTSSVDKCAEERPTGSRQSGRTQAVRPERNGPRIFMPIPACAGMEFDLQRPDCCSSARAPRSTFIIE
jgi:hypothetical protein